MSEREDVEEIVRDTEDASMSEIELFLPYGCHDDQLRNSSLAA